MNRKDTLDAAAYAVAARPDVYGPPEQNFERIARRWQAHLRNRYGVELFSSTIDAVDVAMMMADVKMARLEEKPSHEDSWVDLAGYAACGAEIATK